MSKWKMEKITCPKCGKVSDFKVWSSINTVIDPDMKEQVRNRKAFEFACPYCGAVAYVNYSILYHQMEDKIMIYYVTDEEGVQMASEMLSENQKTNEEAAELKIKTMEGYTNRVVTSQNELLEKLSIFDAGLDDRVVEIIKIIFRVQMQQRHSEIVIDDIFFYQDTEDEYGVQFMSEGKGIATANFGKEMYDKIAGDFEARIQAYDQKTVVVDWKWAVALMGAK